MSNISARPRRRPREIAPWPLITDQKRWSLRTFGPGKRTLGITRHIEKELMEIRANPDDLEEWVDVILLAIDGYWRAGGEDLVLDLYTKQYKNFNRSYPPVGVPEDQPIEHLREPTEEPTA